jgi:hypothetical protein
MHLLVFYKNIYTKMLGPVTKIAGEMFEHQNKHFANVDFLINRWKLTQKICNHITFLKVTTVSHMKEELMIRMELHWNSQQSNHLSLCGCKFNSNCSSLLIFHLTWGYIVAQWLRHCATNQKVAGLIPDGVTGSFHWHNPFGRTMALGSTQPLTEMSARNISWR